MPIFNVMRIYEDRVARISCLRNEYNVIFKESIGEVKTVPYDKNMSYEEWFNYVRNECNKTLSGFKVEKVFEGELPKDDDLWKWY